MSANLQVMPDPQQIQRDLLDVEDVAKRLKVSPQWVRDHATRRHPKLSMPAPGLLDSLPAKSRR